MASKIGRVIRNDKRGYTETIVAKHSCTRLLECKTVGSDGSTLQLVYRIETGWNENTFKKNSHVVKTFEKASQEFIQIAFLFRTEV